LYNDKRVRGRVTVRVWVRVRERLETFKNDYTSAMDVVQ
jgi:hypothetical protein